MALDPVAGPMGFRPLSALVMFFLGGLMMASAHVPKKDGEIVWRHVSGSLFLGAFLVLFGLYLGVTSVV